MDMCYHKGGHLRVFEGGEISLKGKDLTSTFEADFHAGVGVTVGRGNHRSVIERKTWPGYKS